MDALAEELVRLLRVFGPALLTILAFLETSFITGLVVPAGVALLLASFLAAQGTLSLAPAVASAVLGAFLGDSTGFWIGRYKGRHVLGHRGVVGHLLEGHRGRLRRLLQAPPWVGVTLARVVAFVRTLMPISAGVGTMRYSRFLAWDALGIALWALSYVSVGYLAGDGWQRLGRIVGAGWMTVFVAGVALVSLLRRRARSKGNRMTSVALTGNAASGKSTVADVWRGEGVPLVSADVLAREAVAPGSPGLAEVVGAFGDGVLAEDGTLDRSALRSVVLEKPHQRRRLEAILHPRIAALRTAWQERERSKGARLLISEIPLLFESGLETQFDIVVTVHAPREVLKRRLIDLRGLDEHEAELLLAAQIPTADTLHLADHILENVGTVPELEGASRDLLSMLREVSSSAAPADRESR